MDEPRGQCDGESNENRGWDDNLDFNVHLYSGTLDPTWDEELKLMWVPSKNTQTSRGHSEEEDCRGKQ